MKYREGYVAFIDILGFSTYVSNEENANDTYNLFEFVRKFCYLFNSSPELKINVSFFSDSIVLTADDLEKLIAPIYIAESYLKDKLELLFRGGICYGKYYHDNGVAFGPAVVSAYKLEGKANYSRILIDEKIQILEEENVLFYRDIDGYLCLNPMSAILEEPIAFGPEGAVYPEGNINEIINDCFSKHREVILKQIAKNKGTSVVDKYLWRVRVFNYTCNLISDIPVGETIYNEINFSSNEQLKGLIKKQIITEEDVLKC
jgi:hypothetical protein